MRRPSRIEIRRDGVGTRASSRRKKPGATGSVARRCNPSRSSFLTGRAPDTIKVYYFEGQPVNRETPSFLATLRDAGYLSLGTGKLWHWDGNEGQWATSFSKENGKFVPQEYDQQYGCLRTCRPRGCRQGALGCINGHLFAERWDPEEVAYNDALGRKAKGLHFFDQTVAHVAREKLGLVAAERAKGATRPYFRGADIPRVAATPRPRRGDSADESRRLRRRGREVETLRGAE